MEVTVDLAKTVLETPRLRLRPWQKSDLRAFNAYASEEGVGEMAGWEHHKSLRETREILKTFMQQRTSFAIEHKQDRKVIGSFGYHPSWAKNTRRFQDLRLKEIGFVLAKPYWGQGLMPEAIREVLRFSFETLKLDAVTVSHFVHNLRSEKVILKAGFQYIEDGLFLAGQMNKAFDDKRYIIYNPKHSS